MNRTVSCPAPLTHLSHQPPTAADGSAAGNGGGHIPRLRHQSLPARPVAHSAANSCRRPLASRRSNFIRHRPAAASATRCRATYPL
ncbi:MAG UNVERIFIED_CONTAM: hypothetical protein LVR18_36570 [Planctomycetaceae bacterium]